MASATLPRAIQPRPRPRAQYPAGPFVGMRDSLDPTASRPELARLLQNCYPPDPQFGAAVVGRPGFTLTTGQGGSGGARTGQLVYQFTKLDGTEYTVRIIGGRLETYNWGTDAWTNVVTAANFVTAGITVSSTARMYATTFANNMVVNDGVNQPWMWDGQTGAGGLTLLSNAPTVCFGPPTVYYAKLFFIKNAARSTFVWSEENLANTGYEAGGYANVWTLGQTDQEALFCLLGTNEALYAWRARSATAITGAVTPDFKTTGTREGVSETDGTTAPGSVFYDGRRIFFTNADGQPFVILPGAGAVPIWADYRETIRGFDPTQIDDCEGIYNPATGLAMLSFAERGQTRRSASLTYHRYSDLPQASGIFRGYTFDRVGVVKNADGAPRLMHLDANGYAYVHGAPESGPWSDALQTGTLGISHAIHTNYMGAESFDEKNWDRLDFALRLKSDLTQLSVGYETPRGLGTSQPFDLDGSFARWDEAFWDVDSWSADTLDQHKAIGIAGNGRWLVAYMLHDGVGQEFGLARVVADSSIVGAFPGTP